MSCDSDGIAIRVSNVTKIYKIFDTPMQRFMYHMFHVKTGRDFVALDHVSFEVKKGEAFGIIGRNGSGKSTMLQILAGIIKASIGKVEVQGRIAALLELGSGFDPESTGYDNIYMNAAILGVSKEEIDKKVNQIIEFADIDGFVDQPVKTYSSGMFIRLAFAVAINVDADILLIDEALAVGDIFFRQKCYKKLNQLRAEGKTIILVSHGMNEVEQFCDRALLLDKSHALMCDESRKVVQHYYMQDSGNPIKFAGGTCQKDTSHISLGDAYNTFNNWKWNGKSVFNCKVENGYEENTEKIKFLNIGIFNGDGEATKFFYQGEDAFFLYEVEVLQDIDVPLIGIVFYDQRNTIIFGKSTLQTYMYSPKYVKTGEIVRCLFKIKMNIAVGEYTFDAGFSTIALEYYKDRSYYDFEEIDQYIERLCSLTKVGSFAVHQKPVGKPMKIAFHGCCDLPCETELIVGA